MVQIAIRISNRKATALLSNLSKNIPKMAEELPKELAGFAAHAYTISASQANIKSGLNGTFYRTLHRQITRPTRLGKYTYGVSIAAMKRGKVNYFIALDRMEPHAVRLYKGRIITKWARSKGIKKSWVWVRPHPFIHRADQMIMRRIKPKASKKLRQTIRRSKR